MLCVSAKQNGAHLYDFFLQGLTLIFSRMLGEVNQSEMFQIVFKIVIMFVVFFFW